MSDVPEAKRRLLEQLSCRTLFEQWEHLDDELTSLMRDRVTHEIAVGSRKAEVTDAELMASVNSVVEGKNETERKIQRTLALQKDVAYQAAKMQLQQAESALANIDVDIDRVKRTLRRVESKVRYQSTCLQFLA